MWALLSLVIAGGGFAAIYAIGRAVTMQPRVVPVAELREGAWVRVIGTVEPLGEMVKAPASEVPCIAWHVKAALIRGEVWESHAVSMVITDATGSVVARVNDALVKPLVVHTLLSDRADKNPARLAFDKRFKVEERVLTFREGVIQPGARVSVTARVVAQHEAAPVEAVATYRELPPGLIVLELAGGADAIVEQLPPEG
jgi:hypothetical protein